MTQGTGWSRRARRCWFRRPRLRVRGRLPRRGLSRLGEREEADVPRVGPRCADEAVGADREPPPPRRRVVDLLEGGIGEPAPDRRRQVGLPPGRSEEHTSELQSRQFFVCRLLLEKT